MVKAQKPQMEKHSLKKEAQLSSVQAWVGLGGNLGNVQETLSAALQALHDVPQIENIEVSSFYRSAPVDAGGEDFVNAVARFQTTLKPLPLLHLLQAIEQQFGRERPYWHAPRTLDLDLLLYDDLVMQGSELTLPHHAMHERAFVLLPIAELDELVVVPHHGAVKELLNGVKDQPIERIESALWCDTDERGVD